MLMSSFSQPFWVHMIARSGAVPSPLAHATLTLRKLAHAIQFCRTPEAKVAALEIAQKMQTEIGVVSAVDSFYTNLPLKKKMKCKVLPDQVAGLVYKKRKRRFQLSKVAAQALIESRTIEESHIQRYVFCLQSSAILMDMLFLALVALR
jgi:hypothetical protein